jgi:ribosomal protein S18 acetylase RimI-like enzyme
VWQSIQRVELAMDRRIQAFQALSYELPKRVNASLRLEPIDASAAWRLGEVIGSLDPWRRLRIPASSLAQHLTDDDIHLRRWLIRDKTGCAGVVSIRSPWLYGPYLALLAVLPGHQRLGIGSAILEWMETEARGSFTNIWACVSVFNGPAQRFYRSHGFETIGVLKDLLGSGNSELLIRKSL